MSEKNNLEIERKFLIDASKDLEELYIKAKEIIQITQSYIYSYEDIEERIRKNIIEKFVGYDKNGIKHYLTEEEFNVWKYETEIEVTTEYIYTKKIGEGEIREEYETEISKEVYQSLLRNKLGKSIQKTRYVFPYETETIKEVILDYYNNINQGLCVCEIEYKNKKGLKEEPLPLFIKEYIIKEVSNEKKYSNKYMALNEKI